MKQIRFADNNKQIETVSRPEYLSDEAVVIARTTGKVVEIVEHEAYPLEMDEADLPF